MLDYFESYFERTVSGSFHCYGYLRSVVIERAIGRIKELTDRQESGRQVTYIHGPFP